MGEALTELFEKEEELSEELKPYLEEVGKLGLCIRHPLVYSIPHFQKTNAYCNAQLRQKKRAIKEAKAEKNWSQVIWLHERPYRLEAFVSIREQLTDREYWELLSSIWVDSENIGKNLLLWKRMLGSQRSGKEYFMDDEEKLALAALPEKVEVFRGYQPGKNYNGLSYTLSKERAEWFAKRFAKDGKVRTRVVKKSAVFAFLSVRGEQEVILL